MKRFLKRVFRRFSREDGNSTIEFVMVLPVLMLIFTGSFEGSLLMLRSMLLEQAVDKTMRELRLGHYVAPDSALLKHQICIRTIALQNCEDQITIELTRLDSATFDLPSTSVQCVDRDEDINPVIEPEFGTKNDIMLVRVCVIQDAIVPGHGLGLGLHLDDSGGYQLVSVSAFVNEPAS